MTGSEIIALVSIVLLNLAAMVTAWIKVKTDITEIQVKLCDIDSRVKEQEQHNLKTIEKLEDNFEKFGEANDKQHATISDKIDAIKDIVNELKVDMIKHQKVNG